MLYPSKLKIVFFCGLDLITYIWFIFLYHMRLQYMHINFFKFCMQSYTICSFKKLWLRMFLKAFAPTMFLRHPCISIFIFFVLYVIIVYALLKKIVLILNINLLNMDAIGMENMQIFFFIKFTH